jgi:hypothetical protein
MAKTARKMDYSESNRMQDRCVCLSVEFATYGTQRKLDMSKVQTDADKSRIRASKSILDSPRMSAIHSKWGEAYNWLRTKVLPSPFRRGVYNVPRELIDEIDRRLQQFQGEAKPLVEALVAELPELKERDKQAFKSQYNERNYPTADELRSAFFVKTQVLEFRVPDKLSPRLQARETAKNMEAWAENEKVVREFLRETWKFIVGQFANQLRVSKKSKGRIHDSTVKNLKEFAKDFDVRNVTDDDRLLALVARAKGLLDGVDADALRDDERLRAKVSAGMDKIEAEVNGLTEAPLRAIELA